MILITLIVLAVFTALFTTIQTFYLESMRLRTRELPSLTWFREVLEPKLKTRTTEEGATAFSLWKHTCLVVMGVLVLTEVTGPGAGPLVAVDVWEGLGAAVMLMAFSAYLVPQLIYERSSCHWMIGLLPLLLIARVIVRPFVMALNLLHLLIDIVKPQPEDDEVLDTAALAEERSHQLRRGQRVRADRDAGACHEQHEPDQHRDNDRGTSTGAHTESG